MANDENEPDPPLTEEAERYLAIYEQREEKGLGRFPFSDKVEFPNSEDSERFIDITDRKSYLTRSDYREVARIVSSWYVKKGNWFHDVQNLYAKYQPHDVKQVIVHRMKEEFPAWSVSEQD